MTTYIALLRAVNVGGTGKLPMADLVAMAESVGFQKPRTYIASGNLIFESPASEKEVKAALEKALAEYAGKPVGVVVRTAEEMASVLAGNPFPDRPPNHTVAIFLDQPPPDDTLDRVIAPDGEEVALGRREIYVHYGPTMGRSKLRIPAASAGTARNINTISRLAEMSGRGAGEG